MTSPVPDVAVWFLRWSFVRGFAARGYWLVTSVYLVLVADLSAAQLVLLGVGQGIAVVLAEVPAGVLADTVSRRRSLVIAQVVSGSGMVMAGLVTSFPLLAVSQILWGLGWAFASGADVAWITDELGRPDQIDRVLAVRARWEVIGAAAGLVAFGGLAAATDLAVAIVTAGGVMLGLAVVVAQFPEAGFTPAPADDRRRAAADILATGVRSVRHDHVLLFVVVAWLLVNGSAEGFGRIIERRLTDLGFAVGAERPIVWFTAVGIVALAIAAIGLRAVEQRIHGEGVARSAYVACCGIGVVGLLLFAFAPDHRYAVVAVLAVRGLPHGAVLRAVNEIWVNRRTDSAVRATVHSLLSQAENLGEIVFGLLLAGLAGAAGTSVSLTGAAVLLGLAGVAAARA